MPAYGASLRPWFDKLKHEFNLTVLILHHKSKKGDAYGTSFIRNDVNAYIEIEKRITNKKNVLSVGLTMPDNRHGESIDDPIDVELHFSPVPQLRSNAETEIDGREFWKEHRKNDPETIIDKIKELIRVNSQIRIREVAHYLEVSKPSIEKLYGEMKVSHIKLKEEVEKEAYE